MSKSMSDNTHVLSHLKDEVYHLKEKNSQLEKSNIALEFNLDSEKKLLAQKLHEITDLRMEKETLVQEH